MPHFLLNSSQEHNLLSFMMSSMRLMPLIDQLFAEQHYVSARGLLFNLLPCHIDLPMIAYEGDCPILIKKSWAKINKLHTNQKFINLFSSFPYRSKYGGTKDSHLKFCKHFIKEFNFQPLLTLFRFR